MRRIVLVELKYTVTGKILRFKLLTSSRTRTKNCLPELLYCHYRRLYTTKLLEKMRTFSYLRNLGHTRKSNSKDRTRRTVYNATW